MLQRRTAPLRCRQTRQQGFTAKRRAAKARRILRAEQAVKRRVIARDGHRCRWPNCEVPPVSFWGGLEAAHFHAAGMGGNSSLSRCTEQGLISLCVFHHRGPRGLHSPYARMEPRDQVLGMRGVVAFYTRQRYDGEWQLLGVSEPPKERQEQVS